MKKIQIILILMALISCNTLDNKNSNTNFISDNKKENTNEIISKNEDNNKNEEHIKDFSTKELHDELIMRGGVETIVLDPYEKKEITVEGPATVFIVID